MRRLLFLLLFLGFQPLLFGLSFGTSLVTISSASGNSAPQIAVAANGNAFAVWLNFSNTNNIQVAYFNASANIPTGAWSAPISLATGSVPQIGVDQNGNAFIVWVSNAPGTTNQILVTRFNVTTLTFSPFVTLSTGGINGAPQIAVSGIGVAVVIWQNIPSMILSASFTPMTGTWSAPVQVATTAPAGFGLDNFNRGLAIFQTFPQAFIQSLRIFAP